MRAAERVEDQELSRSRTLRGFARSEAARRNRRSCGCGRCRWRNGLTLRAKPRQGGRCCLQSCVPQNKDNTCCCARSRIGSLRSRSRRCRPRRSRWRKQGILDTVGVTLAGATDDTTAVVTRALRKTAAAGRGADLWRQRTSRCAQRRADQRRRVARARFRRLQQHARRPSVGADPAGAVGARDWRLRQGVHRRLCGRRRDARRRLARAVNFHHYDKGWHPTATLGTFGSGGGLRRICCGCAPTRSRPRSRSQPRWRPASRPISAP
mgnify:CR=1 FL=1